MSRASYLFHAIALRRFPFSKNLAGATQKNNITKKVERHVRRLASPLLLRARDRARLHKEAPDALRFGLRRASKGHGTRVSRQCAVSSWVVTAVGGTATSTPATAAAVRAVGAETEGLPKRPNEVDSGAGSGGAPPVTGADTVLGVPNGSASSAGGGRAAEGHEAAKEGLGVQDIEGGFREARPGAPTRKRSPEATGRNPAAEDGSPFSSGYSAASPTHPPPSPLGHGDEALSEVVRLAMTMFDKICSPGEKLDLTLLTVGFAGFRSLGGGAQSGMARCVGLYVSERSGLQHCDGRVVARPAAGSSCL